MSEVETNLLIGNFLKAQDTKFLAENNIKSILSLTSLTDVRVAKESEQFNRLHIKVDDDTDADLVTHFLPCIEFIEEHIRTAGVLVHCIAGISRSGSVVTAFLMKKYSLSLKDALQLLRKKHPSACPNRAFMGQLKIFEDMIKSGTNCKKLSIFYLKKLAKHRNAGKNSEVEKYVNHLESYSINIPQDAIYRCKMCRTKLFSYPLVIRHNSDPYSVKVETDSGNECQHVVNVIPPKWLLDTCIKEPNVEGKINCIKCNAKLGNYNWKVLKCDCKFQMEPAFLFHKSKIDTPSLKS